MAADLGQEKRSSYPESASSGQGKKSLLGKKNRGNKALLAQFLGLRHRMGRVYWPSGVSAQHSSVHGAVLVQLEKTVSPTIVIKITKYFIVA